MSEEQNPWPRPAWQIEAEQAAKEARAELRDEFAKAALIGLLASGGGSFTYEKVREAWEIANAMLKARGDD